jgi:hypothetical protein
VNVYFFWVYSFLMVWSSYFLVFYAFGSHFKIIKLLSSVSNWTIEHKVKFIKLFFVVLVYSFLLNEADFLCLTLSRTEIKSEEISNDKIVNSGNSDTFGEGEMLELVELLG